MRTRKEILDELGDVIRKRGWFGEKTSPEVATALVVNTQLEVLLDIRDLLADKSRPQ